MQRLPRKPRVENKYNIKLEEFKHWKVIDKERITKCPFWRNNIVEAWCLSGRTEGKYGDELDYWIAIYDQNAKKYSGKIKLECSSYGGMCYYIFNEFYNPKDIENVKDLELQEMLLERLNWLLDEKIMERR